MTLHDFKQLQRSRERWLKEQQLIRKKYQVSYNIAYTSARCSPTSTATAVPTNAKRKRTRSAIGTSASPPATTEDFNAPPMFCAKCDLHVTECRCVNGLGRWWQRSHENVPSADQLSKRSSTSFVHFDLNVDDLTSTNQPTASRSSYGNEHYAVLVWNDRQSLLNFLRTLKLLPHPSSLTIEQLHELISKHEHIHVFDSLTSLALAVHTSNRRHIDCTRVYIDPSYYSSLPGSIPWSSSQLLADNSNLPRTLRSIRHIARLLGVPVDTFTPAYSSTKQRPTILHEQASLIASKVPYNTFRPPVSQTS